jgi:hypothetical protein
MASIELQTEPAPQGGGGVDVRRIRRAIDTARRSLAIMVAGAARSGQVDRVS